MEWWVILIIAVAAVVVIALAVFLAVRSRKGGSGKVKIVDGESYTAGKSAYTADGNVSISHEEGDIVLAVGVPQRAVKGGRLMPGKYTVLSSAEGVKEFNLRVGGYVRSFRHGDDIVLADGEEICAVSHTVILR